MTAPHVLAVNFRDPSHPEAGGAELHLEQILLEALQRGYRVTWLASGFRGGASEGEHRGMRIVRRGDWWNFNWVVPGVLRREFSKPSPDWVIEDINKVPCLTPWWTKSPVAAIVPHLFGSTAFQEASWPIALYVVALESLVPRVYRNSRFVVISESTRDDLERRGVAPEQVSVVHCGLDHTHYHATPEGKEDERPTILFVGRLRRYKGVEWLVRSLPAVLARVPRARLVVIGDGPYRGPLERSMAGTAAARAVEFLGFLAGEEKVRWMQRAWVLVQPSPKEGWGLTVVEAGACGTAVVAANSPGLRDSVRDGETGLLVPYDDDARLSDALIRVLTDTDLRLRLAAGGRAWADRFRWPACARASLDSLLALDEVGR